MTKSLKSLSDKELINRLRKLVEKEHNITLEILSHLVEVSRRGLYLAKGYGTLYEYCKGELGYTDASAWRRVRAALAIHRCPEAFDLLKRGRINMCTLGRVHKFITPALLNEIRDKSQAKVELIAAAYDAKGVAPDRTRPVMVPKAVARENKNGLTKSVAASSLRSEVIAVDKRLEFEQKWKVEGVVSDRVKRKLHRCKSLLSNKYPNGVDYDVLFDELTEIFLDREDPERQIEQREKRQEKQKPANKGSRHNRAGITSSRVTAKAHSRHIPLPVQEKVWVRDGGRCVFVGTNGVRCNSTHNLQFDHYPIPFGRGGPSTVENLRLLCGRHNRYTAEQVYGKEQIEKHYRRLPPPPV